MNIYIIGSGGVGGYFGGLLAKAGQNVCFLARGEHFTTLQNNGLLIKSVLGEFLVNPVKVINNISEVTNPKLIIFTVKTYDTETVTKQLLPKLTKDTIIITFQNGIDNDNRIKQIINSNHIYPGIAYVISAKTKPGEITQSGGLRKLIIGDRSNPDNPELHKILEIMKKSSIESELSDDITRDLWKKFIYIIPFAGLTALYKTNIGEILSTTNRKNEYIQCLREVISIAQAENVNLPEEIFETTMKITHNTTSNAKSSLLIDIENNRPTEIETLHGTVVKIAQKHKIQVPITQKVYQALKDL